MSTLGIVVLVVIGLLVLLAVGGAIANAQRQKRQARQFAERVRAANEALARAAAEDRGWDRALMEGVAREEWSRARAGADIAEIHLIEAVDRPGTAEDVAVFRVEPRDGGPALMTLGRDGERWHLADLKDERI